MNTPTDHDILPAGCLASEGDQDTPLQRIKLTVKYDGYDFHGWQKQEPKDLEPLRTAQGVLETAVRRTVRERVNVLGSSRTDAQVHAEGQVAAFTCTAAMKVPVERLHLAINRHLPSDIAVINAINVPLTFDPIQGATSKAYRYTIHNSDIRACFDRHRVYHCWYSLDVDRMHQAAQFLVGLHDFESFANTHHGRESTVRTIFNCSVTQCDLDEERIFIDIAGSGFLYHMVRIIVGTLIEVGRGMFTVEKMQEIIDARSRRAAGPTVPPGGLCLQWIRHGDSKSNCE